MSGPCLHHNQIRQSARISITAASQANKHRTAPPCPVPTPPPRTQAAPSSARALCPRASCSLHATVDPSVVSALPTPLLQPVLSSNPPSKPASISCSQQTGTAIHSLPTVQFSPQHRCNQTGDPSSSRRLPALPVLCPCPSQNRVSCRPDRTVLSLNPCSTITTPSSRHRPSKPLPLPLQGAAIIAAS
ncbi:hypothetical protein M0R45_019247 [Rubus argutus]|uniref:Uncharacterized protein n=1 Tax=Rubus argutus TaxID=59490 RepID=A0AAW1X4V2_RUBAR